MSRWCYVDACKCVYTGVGGDVYVGIWEDTREDIGTR